MTRPDSLPLWCLVTALGLNLSGCQSTHQAVKASPGLRSSTALGQTDAILEPPAEPLTKRVPEKPGVPVIQAKAAILVDHRGRVLFEKNADLRLPTASTQKLLLGILIADSGYMDEPVTVSATDTACEPTKMGIQAGQTYRKGDLFTAVLVRSSNDIARCLARHHSGSESAFTATMNAKARQLGMYNSYFTNSSGLPDPPGQFSTARDLAILARASLQRPLVREAVGTRSMTFRFANGTTQTVSNTNQVLRSNPYCNGCKTGYTVAAGRCLISSATVDKKSVIAVVLGSKTPDVWIESDALLMYGLNY